MELSRVEQILKYFLGEEATLPQPLSRVEELLIALGRLIEEGKITNPISIKGRVNTVNDLPSNAEPGWLYFVGLADATEFTEYIYLDIGRWEYLGSSMISIDTALSTTSTNPVQNSTITTELNKKPGEITTGKQYVIGGQTVTAGTGAEAFNDLNYNKAAGPYSHAEGQGTTASDNVAHAEGQGTTASGTASHAEGQGTNASGTASHAEGGSTTAASGGAHAEGQGTTASGTASHAEGQGTNAGSNCAHAEGRGTTAANGDCAHAEGSGSKAVANAAHAEGEQTTATGQASHTEGVSTIANGKGAHAEGQGTTAYGGYTHAEGLGTTAVSACQHVQGRYNVVDPNNNYAFIIGNGTADNARHNAFAIDWNGLIYVNGTSTGVDVSAFPSPADINTAITKANAAAPQSTTYTKSEVDTALSAKLNTADVDDALSGTSTNPVQNKAVQAPVARLVDAGAKNLLKVTATSQTINGVTFTVNEDQTVTVNGTNTGTGSVTVVLVPNQQAILIPDGDYWLLGCPQGGGSDTFDLRWFHYSPNASAYDIGSGAAIHKSGNATDSNIAIVVKSGVTVNNITFKPMLCTAEDYAISPEFVPYTPTMRELYEMILALQNA